MPSVASHVTAAIAQHPDAKVALSASNADDRADASPFAELLDSNVKPKQPAAATSATSNASTLAVAIQSPAFMPAGEPPVQAGIAGKELAGLQIAVETAVTKVELAKDPALPPKPVVEAPAPQPQPDLPLLERAAFMEAVAAAPQPAQEADTTRPDEAQGVETAAEAPPSDEATEPPADLKAAAAASDVVAAAVAPVLTAQPSVGAPAPASGGVADPAKSAPALAETGQANLRKTPERLETAAALPADDTPEPEQAVAANPVAATRPGKPDAHRADVPKAQVVKSEPAAQAELAAPAPEGPVAPATEGKSSASHLPAAAHKIREAAEPATKSDAVSDLVSTQKGADPGPALALPAQAGASAANAPGAVSSPKDAPAPATAVAIEGVAVEIAARAVEGKHHFEIRLDPPELGRIHVRLDIDRNGEITSRVMTERQDTLDLLRRDAPQLERALNDAGLRTAGNGLQFSLRDQGHGQREQTYFADAARLIVKDENFAAEALPRNYYRPSSAAGGIDIRV